jgi:hypothetical protein
MFKKVNIFYFLHNKIATLMQFIFVSERLPSVINLLTES